jgi:hypothetical protein
MLGIYAVGGRATVDVLGPPDAILVSVDGKEAELVEPNTKQSFYVTKGPHRIRLINRGEVSMFDIIVDSHFDWFLLAGPNQCLALADISKSHYRQRDSRRVEQPSVSVVSAGTLHRPEGNFFYPGRELPTQIDPRNTVTFVRNVPCSIASDRAAVLTHLELVAPSAK